jgi:hypothetical protein
LLSTFCVVFSLHIGFSAFIGHFAFSFRRGIDNLLNSLFALVVGLDRCLLGFVDGYRAALFRLVVTLFCAALCLRCRVLRRLFDGMASIFSCILGRRAGVVYILPAV